MTIYVVMHKKVELPDLPRIYSPLLVGTINASQQLKAGLTCDDTGDHISNKNNSYCELTGLYWMWKNCDSDIIGLVHYRRFFMKLTGAFSFRKNFYFPTIKIQKYCNLLMERDIAKKLKSTDLIVRKSRKYHSSIRNVFLNYIEEECITNVENAIRSIEPDSYEQFKVYLNNRYYLKCNMFIGKKVIMDKYCEWLFTVLAKVDELHFAATGSYYCRRELGYVGEMLFKYWLDQNNVNYVEGDVVGYGPSYITSFAGIQSDSGMNVYLWKDVLPHVCNLTRRYLPTKGSKRK